MPRALWHKAYLPLPASLFFGSGNSHDATSYSFAVSVERWCRLRGNLLFYFKTRDHWSEPSGVIVVEDCDVRTETNHLESTFGIVLTFGGGNCD